MDVKLWVTNQTDKQLCLVSESKMRYINTDAIEEQHHPGDIEAHIVNIHDDVEYQTFGGIGGAFTDTSAYLLAGTQFNP